MRRDEALEKLHALRPALSGYGIKSLALFGSVSRDEAGPESDIDLLVEFDASPSFDRYMDLKFLLEDSLGHRVDLVTTHGLRPQFRPHVERDAIRVA